MRKIVLKRSLILCVIIFILELLNLILYYFLRNFIASFIFKSTIDEIYDKSEVISYIVLIIFSLFSYYYIGKKIFVKLGSKNTRQYVAINSSIIIMLSYPVSEFITQITGEYFTIHLMVCSPIAYLMAIPFSKNEITFVVVLVLFSPISVLLIWLFSRTKKSENDV